ncbi:hypothetical protein [Vibrio sp. WXL210]|uniref:hypothetical protein n=1 Tax=Vibrio sp. WXL210 TaxID=3450709 RepID=UPI003EC7A483
MFKLNPTMLLIAGFTSQAVAGGLVLTAQPQSETQLPLYGKFTDAYITSGIDFENPFDSREIKLDAKVITPSGETLLVPMYFKNEQEQEYHWGLSFTPREIGEYKYQVIAAHHGEETTSKLKSFTVSPSQGKGFLSTDDNQGSWVFDNGERFRGVGLNIAWEARLEIDGKPADNPEYTYEYWMNLMGDNNVSLVRTWINAPWNIPLEWNEPVYGRYSPYEGQGLHPEAIERFDYLIEHAENNDVNLILVMDYHGSLWANDFDNWGNDYWRLNPYNAVNGGPAKTPEEFFTHPDAIARYQDRLRYIVARWGYSTNVAAIEFWNEVDNAVHKEGQNISDKAVTEWHQTMSDYLREVDPYNHIQTTSISHIEIEGLFELEGMEFIQTHLYGLSSTDTEAKITELSERYGKSYAVGEAALGWEGVSDQIEQYADHLHETMWVAMFSQTPFLPMTWWWEDYEEADKYFHFQHMANFVERLTASDELFSNIAPVRFEQELLYRTLSNQDSHYVWVKNSKQGDLESVVMKIDSLNNADRYQVEIYDTWTGETSKLGQAKAQNQTLKVDLPGLKRGQDKVIIVTKA